MSLASSRRSRWLVPATLVAVVAAAVTATAVGVAQASPQLPHRTAAQLLAGAISATPPPLSGTAVETVSLGFPQLPGAAGPTSITSLLAGSHTLNVAYGGPGKLKLALPVRMGETDVISDGTTAWLWQSGNDSATKFRLPAHSAAPEPAKLPLAPAQAASRALAAIGPSTQVSTESAVTIASQPAYQLVLAPRNTRSLIGKVTIALDAAHPGVPLRVQVFARGARDPALQVGFTSISFATPAASTFRFTPPHGAQVHVVTPPAGGGLVPVGALRAARTRAIPGPAIARAALARGGRTSPVPVPAAVPGPAFPLGMAMAGAPRVIGSGWTAVAELPAPAMSAIAERSGAANAAGQAARSATGESGQVSGGAVLGALLASARPVHGSWGTGRLLTTSLLSVLITNDGHMFIGAVTPAALYSAAAKAG